MPPGRNKNFLLRQSSVDDDNTNISIGRSPSITSLPVTMEQIGGMDEPFVQDMLYQLLKDNIYAYKELYQKEQNEKATIKAELESLKAEMNIVREEKKILAEDSEKLKQAAKEAKQLEETKVAMEKELIDAKAKLNKQKSALIAKENECQNLIIGNEKLQSDLQKLIKEKEIADAKLKQATKQLEETKVAMEKELNDAKAKLNEQKSTVIAKENECQNLIIENEKSQSDLQKSIKEKKFADTKLKQVTEEAKQIEETKAAMEKELSDEKAKLNEQKSAVIAKENECQNLIIENEKLQSDLQSTKKHNHILLAENTRIYSTMQELQDTYEKVCKSELKHCFKQNPQEFIQEILQNFHLLKQEVEEKEIIKNKVIQDCIAIMDENDELTRQLNYIAWCNIQEINKRVAI